MRIPGAHSSSELIAWLAYKSSLPSHWMLDVERAVQMLTTLKLVLKRQRDCHASQQMIGSQLIGM